MLVVLVVGHELGHFFAAKAVKMKVVEFGVGFPPKIIGKRFGNGETEYTLNWIPFGGFVRIFGEDPKDANDPAAFTNKHPLAQAFVLFAGPCANMVLAFLLTFSALLIGAPQVVDSTTSRWLADEPKLLVGAVLSGSPADEAGIEVGDEVYAVTRGLEAYANLHAPEELSRRISEFDGPFTLLFVRDGEQQSVTIEPVAGLIEEAPDRRAIGIATALVGTVSYPVPVAIQKAFVTTGENFWFILVSLATLLGSAFTLSADVSQIAGPVGIASLTGDAAAFGLGSLLSFAALLSINLGIINLLPFPALDGGRLLFLGLETVARRKIPVAVAGGLNTIGFGLLILLMLAVTVGDVTRLLG